MTSRPHSNICFSSRKQRTRTGKNQKNGKEAGRTSNGFHLIGLSGEGIPKEKNNTESERRSDELQDFEARSSNVMLDPACKCRTFEQAVLDG